MHLNNVQIKNFKGIKQLRPGFNLIAGENGKGKTSILEAIAVGLGGFIAGIDGVSTRHFTKEEIRREYDTSGDGSCSCRYCVPVEVTMTASFENFKLPILWTRGRSSIQASRSTVQPRDIARIAEQLSNEENADLPLLCYLDAGRV
jgi:Recombinational DNA repair ATPase (RecF pathway)